MENKELTVIYIITKLELGGAQKVCLSLFNGITQTSKITNSYLISSHEGYFVPQVSNNPKVVLLKSLNREIAPFLNELRAFLELICTLRTLRNKQGATLVHTHSTKAGILGRWAAFFAGIPYIVHTIHGYSFHNHQNYITWLMHYLCEWITTYITSHFICVSSVDAETGLRLLPRFVKKYSVIRAAVDIPIIPAQKTEMVDKKGPFVFGTIACFKPQKNLIDLLQAFAVVHHRNQHARLEIIGDGELRPEITSWIAEHDLEEAVILHGWQPHIIPIISRWHAFVLSSLWEGLPCSIIEARLFHLPILSYDTGGIKDVIFHNRNGLLFKPKDWQSLSNAMYELTHNRILYHSLQLYQDDLHEFQQEYMIHKHAQLYKRVAHLSS